MDAWRYSVFVKLSEREGFRVFSLGILKGSSQLLTSSHLRDRDKKLLRAIFCGGVWNGFLLGQAKHDDVPVDFVARMMEMVTCFGIAPFHLYCMLGSFLSLLLFCLWIVVDGLVAYSGMAGCSWLRL